jgi:hypothetical protein
LSDPGSNCINDGFCGFCFEWNVNCFFCAFVATWAIPIIQQSTTTRLQILDGSESEALCALNALTELTAAFLFKMEWCFHLSWVFPACTWLRLSTLRAKFNNQQLLQS